MSYTMRIISYGVLIEKRHINDMLYALTKNLPMEQKKRFYIGHSVVNPISYDDMNSKYQELYDAVDVNKPSFMKTDFGDHWIDYIDMYMEKHYPTLCVSFTADSDDISVHAGTTRSREHLTSHEGLYEHWNSYENERLNRPAGALPLKDRSNLLEGLTSPQEINASVAHERSASIVITDRQREELASFLHDACILTPPKVIAWTEWEGEDDIIFTSWQYGARYPKEQNV